MAAIRGLAARGGTGVRVGIGDDCAVLTPTSGAALIATTDLLLEDVHFRRRWAAPADIGWKALAVNLSDLAAMGADPRARTAYPDWNRVAVEHVAQLRSEIRRGDPHARELADDLTVIAGTPFTTLLDRPVGRRSQRLGHGL